MRVSVDQTSCQGTGYCVELASDVFVLDDSGVAHAVESYPEGLEDLIREAALLCPTESILLAEDT